MYKRTEKAIRHNPPTRGGVMVKCQMGYAVYDDIAFTITTRIDASGAYYVIEEITDETEMKQTLLGWSRDETVKVTNFHPVEVANCVTVAKRSNTQNYVLETEEEDMNEDIKTEVVGTLNEGKWAKLHEQSRRVYGTDGIAPTIHTCGGGGQEIKVATEPIGVSVNPFGRKLEYKGNESIKYDVSPCLRATDYKCPHVAHEKDGRRYRIRKLTERECFRLMGVLDKDIDTIQATGISKTQQYKMAGNSIVVDVLYHIFRKMFVETKADAGTQLELF